MRTSAGVALLCLLLLASTACGGGSGPTGGLDPGSFPLPDESGSGGSTPPTGGGGSPVPSGLAGGVLATFDVQGQRFSMWVPASPVAQALADAWSGVGAPVTAVCAYVASGPGVASHNAPWSWSVDPQRMISVSGLCVGCALLWSTPMQAEAGMAAGPPYNCVDTHAGATWPMVFLKGSLVAFQDLR